MIYKAIHLSKHSQIYRKAIVKKILSKSSNLYCLNTTITAIFFYRDKNLKAVTNEGYNPSIDSKEKTKCKLK